MDQNSLGLGDSLPPDRLTQFELVSAGGQGLLYRARDAHLDRWVAVKLLTTASTEGDLPSSIAAQAQMSWHPHVMTLHDAGRNTSGHVYLVMEYLEGGSCEQARKRGPIPEARALRLASQVASALQAIHEHGVAHCDVKPANVLLDLDDNAHLGDFGSSHPVTGQIATMDGAQGSVMYIAPEVLAGERAGCPADVFALAVTIRALLTGDHPYPETRSIAEAVALRLQSGRLSFAALVSNPRLRTLLEAATDHDPDRRPDLSELITELGDTHGSTPLLVTASPPKRRSRNVALVAAIALIAGAIGGWTMRASPSNETFCNAFGAARDKQLDAIRDAEKVLAADPGQITYRQMESLVKTFPHQFAAAFSGVLEAGRHTPIRDMLDQLPTNGLEDMALADVLYRITNSNEPLIDPRLLEASDSVPLPDDVKKAASVYGHLVSYALGVCEGPIVTRSEVDLGRTIRQVVDEVARRLYGTEKFFTDDPPATAEKRALFTSGVVDVLLSFSVGQSQVLQHPMWFAELLDGDKNVRTTVIQRHFRLLLTLYDKVCDDASPGPQRCPPEWAPGEVQEAWDDLRWDEQNNHHDAVLGLKLKLKPKPEEK